MIQGFLGDFFPTNWDWGYLHTWELEWPEPEESRGSWDRRKLGEKYLAAGTRENQGRIWMIKG